MLDAVVRAWDRLEALVIGLLSICALLVFMSGPVMRAFFPASVPDWTEEVAVYFIVWASLLSGSLLVSDRRHIVTETFVYWMTPRFRIAAIWFGYIVTFIFCSTMLWLGIQAVLFVNMLDERSASTLQAPQAFVLYLSMPVSMALIVGRLVVAGLRPGKAPDITGLIAATEAPRT